MRLSTLLLIVAGFTCTLATIVAAEPTAVGISLSSGYGTISARYPNKTVIDVAKIEGSDAYKAYMRSINDDPSERGLFQRSLRLAQSFRSYWPRHNNALYPMISALRATAETTLNESISTVAVAHPHVRDQSTCKADIQAALERTGLRNIMNTKILNGYAAGTLLAPGKGCDPWTNIYDGSRFFLTVENTRTALSLSLWEEECNYFQQQRSIHSFELGQDSIQACFSEARSNCEGSLRAALQNITTQPNDSGRGTSGLIDDVVMLGEAADDDRLFDILKDVLKTQTSGLSQPSRINMRNLQFKRSQNSAFAASQGAARFAAYYSGHDEQYLIETDRVRLLANGFLNDTSRFFE